MKRAILITCVGTGYADALKATVHAIKSKLKTTFNTDVFLSFTSDISIKNLKMRSGENIHTVRDALQMLYENGYTDIFCVPFFIMNGSAYEKACAEISLFKDKMNISVSRALISSKEDFRKITDIFKKRLTDKNRLYVFMGHGSSHMANSLYTSLADKFFDAGMDNVYIATLNAKPSIDDILRISRASGKKDVTLMPFMLLSGKHTRSDMALKWKALFEENGFNVTCSMTSLGEIKEIQEIFCEHLGEIFENTDGCMA